MKSLVKLLLFIFLFSAAGYSTTRYVDVNCTNSQHPYTTWETAATVIQDAVDVANPGDIIYVGAGVYTNGVAITPAGNALNRVVINKPVSVRSLNGPSATVIVGEGPIGPNAKRCAYVGSFASLSGFSLSNGFTSSTGDYYPNRIGGGALVINGGSISNCYITRCESDVHGGGLMLKNLTAASQASHCIIYDNKNYGNLAGAGCGTFLDGDVEMRNCLIYNNRTGRASGVLIRGGGSLVNSTVCHNQGVGLELQEGAVVNSIIYYNTGLNCDYGDDYNFTNCCSYPLYTGDGNITNEPVFVNALQRDYHLNDTSPCINAGLNLPWMATETDLDGNKRIHDGIVDIGTFESDFSNTNVVWLTSPVTPPVITTAPNTIIQIETKSLSNGIAYVGYGPSPSSILYWQEAVIISGTSPFTAVADIRIHLPGTWYYAAKWLVNNSTYYGWNVNGQTNQYGPWAEYVITVTNGLYHFVSQTSTNPTPPYSSWDTAATVIQDAIDVAMSGAVVYVDAGIYTTGSTVTPGGHALNRIMINKPISVRSVYGPSATIIVGEGPISTNARRCVYLGSIASLSGFTLSNGYTSSSGDYHPNRIGGGALVTDDACISNCYITRCESDVHGGGLYLRATTKASHCRIYDNKNYGNLVGAGCGAFLSGNVEMRNCLIYNNRPGRASGVLIRGGGRLVNTTVCHNRDTGLELQEGAVVNSIIYYNTGVNCDYGSHYNFTNSCSYPLYSGDGNITNEPMFVDAVQRDYHLSTGSPCINTGMNLPWMLWATDLDGNKRIHDGTVDMGAYEYNFSITNVVWLTSPISPPVITSAPNSAVQIETKSMSNGIAYVGYGTSPATIKYWQEATVVSGSSPFTAVADIRIQHPGTWYYAAKWHVNNAVYYGWNMNGQTNKFVPWAEYFLTVTNAQYHFVSQDSTNPVPPYANWATAATVIQDAIDIAATGAVVYVNDGVYANGSTVTPGGHALNRVMLNKPISVLSVNGPSATVIVGEGPFGPYAKRCAYIGSSASLSGFTLSNGYTSTTGDYHPNRIGGGALVSDDACISNCYITRCESDVHGGGLYLRANTKASHCIIYDNKNYGNLYGAGCGAFLSGGVEMRNCLIYNNRPGRASGVLIRGGGRLVNSTVCHNQGTGLELQEGAVVNSIIYYNTSVNCDYGNRYNFTNSCSYPLYSGDGNITNEPMFVNVVQRNYRLSAKSPCIDAGMNLPWMLAATDLDGNMRIRGKAVDIGTYECNYSTNGQYRFVSQTSPNPTPPYTSWDTAAHRIQDAVTVSSSGDVVVVSDGVYNSGLTVTPGYSALNRVMIDKPITVTSLNGPEATVIAGAGPMGTSAVRCVYLTSNAFLTGFTLSNGYTSLLSPRENYSGGGALIDYSGTISNCVITCSQAQQYGAGVALLYGGSIYHSYVTKNISQLSAGGIYGYYGGDVYKCIVSDNESVRQGGVYFSSGGRIYNSLITENYASEESGGLALGQMGTAYNCTIVDNTAPQGGGVTTLNAVSLWNCIIYDNKAPANPNYWNKGTGESYNYCCTYPIVCGIGIITNDPEFVSATDFRLMPSSPCKNRGVNMDWMYTARDLNNNQRIYEGIVDMGAYEFVPEPSLCVVFLLLAFIVRKNR